MQHTKYLQLSHMHETTIQTKFKTISKNINDSVKLGMCAIQRLRLRSEDLQAILKAISAPGVQRFPKNICISVLDSKIVQCQFSIGSTMHLIYDDPDKPEHYHHISDEARTIESISEEVYTGLPRSEWTSDI